MLLLVFGSFALMLLFIGVDWFERDERKIEAKEKGHYYEVNSAAQTYFNKKVRVDAVIYGDGELIIYMTGTGKIGSSKLPNSFQVITDKNEALVRRSASISSSLFRARGNFKFSDVPDDILEITVYQEAFGEKLVFPISLNKGGSSDE